MRKMDSAFLCQTEAIDIPRIDSEEGKPIAKCSFRNNLQSVGPAMWSLLVLTDKGIKCSARGQGWSRQDLGEDLSAQWKGTLQSPGISVCLPQGAVGWRSLQVREAEATRGFCTICFPCPSPLPYFLSDPLSDFSFLSLLSFPILYSFIFLFKNIINCTSISGIYSL